mgnify:FL=1
MSARIYVAAALSALAASTATWFGTLPTLVPGDLISALEQGEEDMVTNAHDLLDRYCQAPVAVQLALRTQLQGRITVDCGR